MANDARLGQRMTRLAHEIEPDTEERLAQTIAAAHRRRPLMAAGTLAAQATVVVILAVVVVFTALTLQQPSADPAGRPAASPSPSTSPTPATSPDPLVGTWATGEVTCDEINAAIANGGFSAEDLQAYQRDALFELNQSDPCPTSFSVRFDGERMIQYQNRESRARVLSVRYRLTGPDSFEADDGCGSGVYCIEFRFQIQADTLLIDVVKDESLPNPELDFFIQTAIFESRPFTRMR